MKTRYVFAVVAAVALVAVPAMTAGKRGFRATLDGYQEVPPVATTAHGELSLSVAADGTSIDYQLSYDGLSSAPSMAHIHFGTPGVNGGVSAFLCSGSKPACPASGTITGTIVASDVVGPAAQGIGAGELPKLLDAIAAGAAYANIHTANFGGGEIRGQIR